MVSLQEMGKGGLVAYAGNVTESYTSELYWPDAYGVYDEMRRRDPTIRTMWNALILLARTASWYVEPASEEDADRQAADFVQVCIEDMSHPIEDYIEDGLSCVMFGWSWLELVYKRRKEDGRIGWQKWAMRRQSSFARWKFDDTGGVQAMVQRPAPDYEEITIPIEKSLHFTSQRDGGNPEGMAILESIYEPWYYLKNYQIIQGIGWQRTFVGLPVFEFQAKPSDDDLSQVQTIGQALTVDEKQYVSVPESVKFKLESAQNSGAEALLNTIKYYRLLMLQTMLADFINLGVGTTGSWALGSDKSQLFLMAVDGFLDRIATVINRFGVPRLLGYNAPYQGAGRPRIVHTKVEKPALGQLGNWLQQVNPLLTWTEEDENWIRKRTGMPTLAPGAREQEPGARGEGLGARDEGPLAEFAAYDGRDVERAEVENSLLDEIKRFLAAQLKRIKETVGQGLDVAEDDGFWDEERQRFRQTFLTRLTQAVNALIDLVVDDTTEQLGGGADWAEVNADAAAWARTYVGELITKIMDTTRRSVREVVASWIETGAELKDLVDLLAPTFGDKRAELIASTEVTRAFDEANDLVRQRVGLPATKKKAPAHPLCRCATRPVLLPNMDWVIVWYTVRGDRVCRQPLDTPWGRVTGCRELHGMIVSDNYGGRKLSEVRAEVSG